MYRPVNQTNLNARRRLTDGKIEVHSGDNNVWWNDMGTLRQVQIDQPAQVTTDNLGRYFRLKEGARCTQGWINDPHKFAGIRPGSVHATGQIQIEDSFWYYTVDGLTQFQDWDDLEILSNTTTRVGLLYGIGTRRRVLAVRVPTSADTFELKIKKHLTGVRLPEVNADGSITFRTNVGQFLCKILKPIPRYVGTQEPILDADGKVYDVLRHVIEQTADGVYIYKRPGTGYDAFLSDMRAAGVDAFLANEQTVYSGTADGYTTGNYNSDKATARTAGAYYAADTDTQRNSIGLYYHPTNLQYSFRRAFLNFDVSALSLTVDHAQLYVHGSTNGGVSVTAQLGTQGIPVSTADQNAFSGAAYDTVPSWNHVDYNNFDLASATSDINAVVGSGVFKVCLREGFNDYSEDNTDNQSSVLFGLYFSDQTGTSQDPYLLLTGRAGGGSAQRNRRSFFVMPPRGRIG